MRRPPIKDEEAPRVMKMVENPAIKAVVLKNILGLFFESLISSTDKPVTKEIYTGTKGRTQGERNDMTPAKKARVNVTSVIRFHSHEVIIVF